MRASMPNGAGATAPRPGRCWRNTPADWPEMAPERGEAADRPRRAAGLDRALAAITEVPAAVLLALEIVVLFAGVVSRYVFHAPLTWSDELASLLFLWLAMLGTVIALRRGEHMRMTALINRCRLPARYFFDQLGLVAALVFFGAILL